jgi:hypothetical protein
MNNIKYIYNIKHYICQNEQEQNINVSQCIVKFFDKR